MNSAGCTVTYAWYTYLDIRYSTNTNSVHILTVLCTEVYAVIIVGLSNHSNPSIYAAVTFQNYNFQNKLGLRFTILMHQIIKCNFSSRCVVRFNFLCWLITCAQHVCHYWIMIVVHLKKRKSLRLNFLLKPIWKMNYFLSSITDSSCLKLLFFFVDLYVLLIYWTRDSERLTE